MQKNKYVKHLCDQQSPWFLGELSCLFVPGVHLLTHHGYSPALG
jgi:hypothetical protein